MSPYLLKPLRSLDEVLGLRTRPSPETQPEKPGDEPSGEPPGETESGKPAQPG